MMVKKGDFEQGCSRHSDQEYEPKRIVSNDG